MNSLTKLALGMIGQLKPEPAEGYAVSTLPLPPAQTTGGLPLMPAMAMALSADEQVLVAQTVGLPAHAGPA